jgi:hypothetical protein
MQQNFSKSKYDSIEQLKKLVRHGYVVNRINRLDVIRADLSFDQISLILNFSSLYKVTIISPCVFQVHLTYLLLVRERLGSAIYPNMVLLSLFLSNSVVVSSC